MCHGCLEPHCYLCFLCAGGASIRAGNVHHWRVATSTVCRSWVTCIAMLQQKSLVQELYVSSLQKYTTSSIMHTSQNASSSVEELVNSPLSPEVLMTPWPGTGSSCCRVCWGAATVTERRINRSATSQDITDVLTRGTVHLLETLFCVKLLYCCAKKGSEMPTKRWLREEPWSILGVKDASGWLHRVAPWRMKAKSLAAYWTKRLVKQCCRDGQVQGKADPVIPIKVNSSVESACTCHFNWMTRNESVCLHLYHPCLCQPSQHFWPHAVTCIWKHTYRSPLWGTFIISSILVSVFLIF